MSAPIKPCTKPSDSAGTARYARANACAAYCCAAPTVEGAVAVEELVDIVDEDDRVVRQATRSEMRRERLLHRVVAILCFNSRGEIYVHQRTAVKDLFPSLYDMFVAGTVEAGETYEATALRELEEEVGIRGVQL